MAHTEAGMGPDNPVSVDQSYKSMWDLVPAELRNSCCVCEVGLDEETEEPVVLKCPTCGVFVIHKGCLEDWLRTEHQSTNTRKQKALEVHIRKHPETQIKKRNCPKNCGRKIDDAEVHKPGKRKANDKVAIETHDHQADKAKPGKGGAPPSAPAHARVKKFDKLEKKRGPGYGKDLLEHAPGDTLTGTLAEFAAYKGFVDNPDGFHVRICRQIRRSGDECSSGSSCRDAHSWAELRIDKAIDLGVVNPDYKAIFCKHAAEKDCPQGVHCPYAHGGEEFRVVAAIATRSSFLKHRLGLGDAVTNSYRTEYCPYAMAGDSCPNESACMYAHDPSQLRRYAAADLGLPDFAPDPERYKTQLCNNYVREGSCKFGLKCSYAHGFDDMRLAAAVFYGTIKLHHGYKNVECDLKANCTSPGTCWFFHNDRDHLEKEVLSRCVLCPKLLEMGFCDYQGDGTAENECPFAHGVSELKVTPLVKRKLQNAGLWRTPAKPEESVRHSILQGTSQAVRDGKLPDPSNDDYISASALKRMKRKAARAQMQAEGRLHMQHEISPEDSSSVFHTAADALDPYSVTQEDDSAGCVSTILMYLQPNAKEKIQEFVLSQCLVGLMAEFQDLDYSDARSLVLAAFGILEQARQLYMEGHLSNLNHERIEDLLQEVKCDHVIHDLWKSVEGSSVSPEYLAQLLNGYAGDIGKVERALSTLLGPAFNSTSSTGGEYLPSGIHNYSEDAYEPQGPYDCADQVPPSSDPDEGFAPPASAYIMPQPFDTVQGRPEDVQTQDPDPSYAAHESVEESLPPDSGLYVSSQATDDVSTSAFGAEQGMLSHTPFMQSVQDSEFTVTDPPVSLDALHIAYKETDSSNRYSDPGGYHTQTSWNASEHTAVGAEGAAVVGGLPAGIFDEFSFSDDPFVDGTRYIRPHSVLPHSVCEGQNDQRIGQSSQWGGLLHEANQAGWPQSREPLQGLKAPLAQTYNNLAGGTHVPLQAERVPAPGLSQEAGISGTYRPGSLGGTVGFSSGAGKVSNAPNAVPASGFSVGLGMPSSVAKAKEQQLSYTGGWGAGGSFGTSGKAEADSSALRMHRPVSDGLFAERKPGLGRAVGLEANSHAASLARHDFAPTLPGFPMYGFQAGAVAPNSEVESSAKGAKMHLPADGRRNGDDSRTVSRGVNDSDFDVLARALGFDDL